MTLIMTGIKYPETCFDCPFKALRNLYSGPAVCIAHNRDIISNGLDEQHLLKPRWCPILDFIDLDIELGIKAEDLRLSEEGKDLDFIDGYCWTMNEISLLKPKENDNG